MSSASGSATSGSARAASTQQLADKLKYIQRTTKLLVKASALVAGGKHTTSVTMRDGGSAEVKGKDITDLTRQLNILQGSLKRDVTSLAKRRRNANNQGGQGFGNPKLYREQLSQFLAAAAGEFSLNDTRYPQFAGGRFDINTINAVRQQAMDKAWSEKHPGTAAPRLPPAAAPNPGSNVFVEQLSLVNSFEGTGTPFGAASILTPLMCIYAALTKMHELAQPPAETVNFLKHKYLIKEATKTEVYKDENRKLGKGQKPLVTSANVESFVGSTRYNQVMADNSPNAPWRNKQYLGATQTMKANFGAELFAQAQQRDMGKYQENQRLVSEGHLNKNGRPLASRNLEEKPYVSDNYFPYAELQVFSSILAIGDAEAKGMLGGDAAYLEKNTPENTRLREQLARETSFLKAYLSFLNATEMKGRSGKYNREIANLL